MEPDGSQKKPGLTLERYLEDQSNLEQMASPVRQEFTTGKVPNSKSGDTRPRLLLMGQRRYAFTCLLSFGRCLKTKTKKVSRSGKSSISSVVFHKMPATETLFLESTSKIQKDPVR
jgi:Ras-related GTP-binding protein C/D